MAEEPAPGPLTVAALPRLLTGVHAALAAERRAIDELNVFPVPDGDTGTNMTLTVAASLDALEAAGPGEPGAVAAAVRGAVRGARGNSGVVLSQVLRALVEAVDAATVDTGGLARLLGRARDLAYDAVGDPVEGTILSAIDAAARAADEAVGAGDRLEAALRRVGAAVRAAVARTPQQLRILREQGVVDAGARGFEVVVGAVESFVLGHAVVPAPRGLSRDEAPLSVHESCTHATGFRFEVQYLLEADDEVAAGLRDALGVLGDSVVVVAAGGLLNVHVHTDEIGGAIEEGSRRGRPSSIQVVDLVAQVTRRAAAQPDAPAALGCVATVSGSGLMRLVGELGAVAVPGRGGELPSVADLLSAVGEIEAERVVILPGHPSAVAAARRAADVSVAEGGRAIDVVDEASSPPAVLAALAVCDPAADGGAVLDDMRAAARSIRTGEVVAAVRDADTPAGEVAAGQHLTVLPDGVASVHDDPLEALESLACACDAGHSEAITVIVGGDVGRQERRRAVALLRRLATDAELEVLDGGQRPTRYWIGLE